MCGCRKNRSTSSVVVNGNSEPVAGMTQDNPIVIEAPAEGGAGE